MYANLIDPLCRLRVIALFEGSSFIFMLFISRPLRIYLDMADFGYNVGLIHGLLFVIYILFAIENIIRRRINFVQFLRVFVASIIPFGTFFNDKMLRRQQEKFNNLETV